MFKLLLWTVASEARLMGQRTGAGPVAGVPGRSARCGCGPPSHGAHAACHPANRGTDPQANRSSRGSLGRCGPTATQGWGLPGQGAPSLPGAGFISRPRAGELELFRKA